MKKRNRISLAVEIVGGKVCEIHVGDEVLLPEDVSVLVFPKWLSGVWVTVVGITPRDTLVVRSSLDGDWTRRVNPSVGVVGVNRVLRTDHKKDVRLTVEDLLGDKDRD